MREVKQSVMVETTPELAFEAVTRDSELREWFCDWSRNEVRPGGRYALHWNQGYHVEGRYLELDPPRRAVMAWRGSGEPDDTRVEFTIDPASAAAPAGSSAGVEVTCTHGDFGPGAEWDEPLAEAQKGWQVALENLKSTLETGIDLRTARQPYLGIALDLLTPERSQREGIGADYGIYVTGTVPESAAEAAGLCSGDVITALGGVPTLDFQALSTALRAHQAGDQVSLELVRGQEQRVVQITLGQRPQPEVPATAGELAGLLSERCLALDERLQAAVAGLTEEEAGECPDEGEWSVKQILAHLSDGERAGQVFLTNIAVNGWVDAAPIFNDMIGWRLEAILAGTPTVAGLVDRFIADEAEMVEILRRLPDQTLAHKARFRRISQLALLGPDHTREHIEQIEQVVSLVRA
jgi:uncharacterized protein YndB with AHSA1/START domain